MYSLKGALAPCRDSQEPITLDGALYGFLFPINLVLVGGFNLFKNPGRMFLHQIATSMGFRLLGH